MTGRKWYHKNSCRRVTTQLGQTKDYSAQLQNTDVPKARIHELRTVCNQNKNLINDCNFPYTQDKHSTLVWTSKQHIKSVLKQNQILEIYRYEAAVQATSNLARLILKPEGVIDLIWKYLKFLQFETIFTF